MPLKIALYYPYIHLRSGVERTILEVLKRSRHDWHVFTNLYEKDTTYPEFENFKSRITELKKISVERSYFNTLRSAWIIFNQELPLEGFDVLCVHNEGLGSLINFKNKDITKICICYTPLKVIYDAVLRRDYISKNLHKAIFYFPVYFLFKVIDKKAFKLYALCFCISKEVRGRILKNNLLPDYKLKVLNLGVDTMYFSGNTGYGNYFFHPTRIKWWKNIELSIEAFNILQMEHEGLRNFKLIIAGELYKTNNSYYEKLKKMAAMNKNIIITINPSEKDILNLYKNCRAVLSTTLNEDFGLTVLEGFSFSKPVIAINNGGPKEIIRNGITGFLSSPDAREYASYLCKIAMDAELPMQMGSIGRKDVIKYDWSNFINYIDDFLEDLALNKRKGIARNLKL
nr:glycosyltransferase family 4 protein [Candidatus Omnitrophota bacterium]